MVNIAQLAEEERQRTRQGALGIVSGDADDRPWDGRREIEIVPDEHLVIQQAVEALTDDPSLYQRAGQLIRVVPEAVPVSGDPGDPGPLASSVFAATLLGPRLRPLTPAALREPLSAVARFVSVTREPTGHVKRVQRGVPAYLPLAVANRGVWPKIRPLVGLINTPVLRPDGSLVTKPGYDPATGLLYCPVGEPVEVLDNPTRDDALEACGQLLQLTADFPFATPSHQSAWLAFVLSLVGRPAYAGSTPLFLTDANTPGTGKTLLLEAAAMIATGTALARMTWPNDDDEFRKTVTAAALNGDPVLLLDNLDTPLGGASLDAALTSTTWKGRRLGASEIVECPLMTVWCASGNNVAIRGDTARRVMHIRLESPVERPEERTGFRYPDLLAYVRRERPRLVAAALTILRAFFEAGSPQSHLPTWGSFEAWSGLVRQSLVWLGLPDPAESKRDLLAQSDREGTLLRSLLAGLQELDPEFEGRTSAQIARSLADHPLLHGILRDTLCELCGVAANKLDPRRIGHKLRKYTRRVCEGMRLVNEANRERQMVWKLETVTPF